MVLEAAQKRLTYISGSRDDVTRAEMAKARDADLVRRVWDELHNGAATIAFDEMPSYESGDVDTNVAATLEALEHAGFARAAVVDVSGDSPDPRVVKVVVPGAYGPYGSALAPPRPVP